MEYPIYTFLYFLDDLVTKNEIELSKSTDECGGFEISYEILSDDEIVVNYGWGSYEEHENNIVKIKFEISHIEIIHEHSGHCVHGGDYKNVNELIFGSEDDLILYFKEQWN